MFRGTVRCLQPKKSFVARKQHASRHPGPPMEVSLHCIEAQRKINVATTPSSDRIACSRPHLSTSARLVGPAAVGPMASSSVLVGRMIKSVYGQFAIKTSAPKAHRQSVVCHQASKPSKKPTTANGACI